MNPIMVQPSISILTALSGGILSFFSPCVFPLIPIYFAILFKDITKPIIVIFRMLGFFIGFSIFFTFLGVLSGSIGVIISKYFDLINIFGGIIIIVLGILYIFEISIIKSPKIKIDKFNNKSLFSSIILGIIIGIVWVPCAGPVLGSIMTLAATTENIFKSSVLLFVYSLGISFPFLLFGSVISKANKKISFSKKTDWSKIMRVISGILLIIIGILMLTGNFNKIQEVFI